MATNTIYLTNFNEQHIPIPGHIAELRNWFVEQALANKCKFLLFVDEDVSPPGHALRQLMYMMDKHPEAIAIGGVVCHKAEPHAPMVFRTLGAGPYWDFRLGEFFEVSGIGMGTTLLRVAAFEKLKRPWFETIDNASAFLDGIPKMEAWTEDLKFCSTAIEAGWKVYCDASVICEHWDMQTLRPATLPPDSKPMLRLHVPKGKQKVVDLGCGESPYKTDEGEVVTVDIRDEVKPDYRCDLRRLPFATESMDCCYSSHTLEHFSRAEVPAVLDEWIRILKPDGELRLILPDIEWAAQMIANGVVNEDVLNVVLGAQNFNGKDSPWNYHKFCFTPKTLTEMLKARGFKRIDLATQYYNLYCRAWRKPPKQVKPAPGWPQVFSNPQPASEKPKPPSQPKRVSAKPHQRSRPQQTSATASKSPASNQRRHS